MSRRARAPVRTVLPDPKYNNEMLAKFMNVVMKNGKKSVAERIVYGALDRIAEKTGRQGAEAIEVLAQALENVKINTKVGGRLFIAIYNDCGEISRYWMKKKITYNKLPTPLKLPYAVAVWTPIEFRYFLHYLRNKRPLEYFSLWTEYKKSRGMSRWHDMIDWIGGYPYEYASAQQLVDFYERDGFKVRKLVPNDGYGCHQLVFERVS